MDVDLSEVCLEKRPQSFIGAQGRVHRLVLNIHKKLNVFLSDMVVALIAGGA